MIRHTKNMKNFKKIQKIGQKRGHCFYTNEKKNAKKAKRFVKREDIVSTQTEKLLKKKAAKRLVKRVREDIVSNMGTH